MGGTGALTGAATITLVRTVIHFGFHVEIERPVHDVFAFVTDPWHLPEWQTNTIEVHTDPAPPLRPGTRLREIHPAPFGKRVESDVLVAALEPDRLLELHIENGPAPIDGRWEFSEPGPGRTLIRFSASGEIAGPLRILGPLLRLGFKRQMLAHHKRLKQVLEKDPER